MSFDVWLENRTPFQAETHVQMDGDGQEVLVAMVSASFVAPKFDATLEIARDQLAVQFADVPYGDPALSSNQHEADIAPLKPRPELLVLGSAYAPPGQPAAYVTVGLEASGIEKRLRVTGDRIHVAGDLSPPRPFQTMPIRWERAFGGSLSDGNCDQRNPVGIGYKNASSADPDVRSNAPNIAYADGPEDRPAGLTPVGRGWLPRLPLAGTYDDGWLSTQWPLPPKDFDPGYNLCAPADQRSDSLMPHTSVRVTNMTPNGEWRFRIPALTAPLTLIFRDRIEERELTPDTVVVESDIGRVTLKARIAITIERNRPKLTEIVFGHVTAGWLIARRKGKTYLAPQGGDGTLTERPVWAA